MLHIYIFMFTIFLQVSSHGSKYIGRKSQHIFALNKYSCIDAVIIHMYMLKYK